MMNKTDRDNWRKFLGIKDPQTALDAARIGGNIGKTAGRAGGSVGGGSFDGENPPEGEEEEGAEKGDGGADASEKLKVGDKFDRLEDLYDCETDEKVTIDGLGEKEAIQYPSGLENCQELGVDPEFVAGQYWTISTGTNKVGSRAYTPILTDFAAQTRQKAIDAGKASLPFIPESLNTAINSNSGSLEGAYSDCYSIGCDLVIFTLRSHYCTSEPNTVCDLPPPKQSVWPAVDKNHLVWNKEKGCFEPLCPELNTQVSDKYKGCEDERILCDEDGNKVKVEVDGNGVKITQAKYNQTAEFRNGKVTAVKKLTESQTEAEFK